MHISMNNAEMLGQGSQYVTRLKVGKPENRYSCPVGKCSFSDHRIRSGFEIPRTTRWFKYDRD
jgi:hypothetical protein